MSDQQVDYLDLSNGGQSFRRGLSQDLYVSMLGSVPIGRKVLEGQYEYELDGVELTTDLLEYFGAESWQQALAGLEGAVEVEQHQLRGAGRGVGHGIGHAPIVADVSVPLGGALPSDR